MIQEMVRHSQKQPMVSEILQIIRILNMRQYVGFGSKQSKYHKSYHMIYKFLEEKMIIMGSRIKKSHFQETARSWAEEDSNAFFHEKYISIF